MNFWARLKSCFSGPRFLRDHAGTIQEAFVYKGETYYCHADAFAMSTGRGLTALDFFDEISCRCTRDFLIKHTEAVEAILTPEPGKKMELLKLATLVKNLKDRLTMIPTAEMVYRLASVVFFTADESPWIYEKKYAEAKIKKWKKDPEILAFFLQMPLKDWISSCHIPENASPSYFQAAELIDQIHLRDISQALSAKGTKADTRN